MTHDPQLRRVPKTVSARFLWDDIELFQDRYDKSATALVLTKRLVEGSTALAAEQRAVFLDLYRSVADANPELFTRVWRDPVAYYWVRLTYELLRAALGGAPLPRLARAHCAATGLQPREALGRQLTEFGHFALGVAVLAGEDLELRRPFEVALPFAIPGTALSLDGEGRVEITGLRGRTLLLRRSGQALHLSLDGGESARIGISLCEAPSVAVKGCQVILQPHLFNNLPAVIENDPVVGSGHAYQRDFVEVLRQGLELMERHHPRAFAQFARIMSVVAVKPLNAGGYVNVSYSDLPGASVISATQDPYEMADVLIHEFHHNRLFFIEENGKFFEDGEAAVGEKRYYSPWRSDPRALMGILHGLYVFVPVREFWGNVARDEQLDARQREVARNWVARNTLELSIGVHQLRHHARFTSFGRTVFRLLTERVRSLQEEMLADGLSYDCPAFRFDQDGLYTPALSATDGHRLSVREQVLNHLQNYAPSAQFEEIRSTVDFG